MAEVITLENTSAKAEETQKKTLEEMTAVEQAEYYQGEVEKYKGYIKAIKEQDKLEEEEKKCIEDIDTNDAKVKEITYELPKKASFDGKTYLKEKVCEIIADLLSKGEYTYQYTLGMYEIVKKLRSNPKELTYGELDSVLRLLGQQKYNGFAQWQQALILNEYFKPLHESYLKTCTLQQYYALRHSTVIDQMDLIKPVGEVRNDPD